MVLKSLADMIEAKIELTKNMFNKVEPCLFVCVCGWGVGGNAVILWWGVVFLFVWESQHVPKFAIWVLWGLKVQLTPSPCSTTKPL